MPTSVDPGKYSIAAVSKLTGVSCHSLRIWERRYGFPVPDRSGSGHRRYTPSQVRLLRRIAELAPSASSISALVEAAREGKLLPAEPEPASAGADLDAQLADLIERLTAADLKGADKRY